MSCTALGANPAIGEVLWCGVQMGAGGFLLATILVFALMVYGMYKFRIPFELSLPLGIFLAFVFAGAGNAEIVAAAGGADVFTLLVWGGIIVVAAISFMAVWRLGKR